LQPILKRSVPRHRGLYGAAIVLAIGLGLASRKFPAMFPAALEEYPGDALWAGMVFAGYCLLFPMARTWQPALLALVTSFAVEFSQLIQIAWLDQLRAITPGRLVLGSTFNQIDLLAYAIGIGSAAMLDRLWLSGPRELPA